MGFLPDMCDYFVDEVMNDPDYEYDKSQMYGSKWSRSSKREHIDDLPKMCKVGGKALSEHLKKVFEEGYSRKAILLGYFKWLNSKDEAIDIREIDDDYYEKFRKFILTNKIIEHYEIRKLDDERILYKIKNNKKYDVLNMNCGTAIKTIINNSLIIDDKIDPRELRSFKLFGEEVGVYQGNIFSNEENINRRTISFHDRLIEKYSLFSEFDGNPRYVKTFVIFEEGKNTFREQIIERVYELRKYFPELKYIDDAIEIHTSNNLPIKDLK